MFDICKFFFYFYIYFMFYNFDNNMFGNFLMIDF